MSIKLEEVNPYVYSGADEPKQDATVHYWEGHKFEVEAEALPWFLWQVGRCTVTVDDDQKFPSAQFQLFGDFNFSFEDRGLKLTARFVEIPFTYVGYNIGYRLSIGKELIADSKVVILNGGKSIPAFIAIVCSPFVIIVCAVAIMSLLKSL